LQSVLPEWLTVPTFVKRRGEEITKEVLKITLDTNGCFLFVFSCSNSNKGFSSHTIVLLSSKCLLWKEEQCWERLYGAGLF